ncbi:MAG TPA: hypothetical protein PK637_13390 [Flavobacteriales bacterium]|nr:hypothetical protein [Flavobacteriales bacterium]HRJ37019.1 hypothetical protein [Flavobacteriales bacterium]HRJ39386.1 hypothetical protein [Flavobacteriales bacterium]
MNEKRLISTVTLLTSLCGYFYAKHIEKDAVPIVMISGFFGAVLGETIYSLINEKDDNDKHPPSAI